MQNGPGGAGESDALQAESADWFARMRGPDAEQDRAAFEAWLAVSPEHRAAYDRIALRWQQADLLSHTPSGRHREGLPARTRRVRPVYALAASLVAILTIGITAWLWSGQMVGGKTAAVEVAETSISSPVGIRRLRLSDGSVITLDTQSRLTVRMTQGERRIVLTQGRARFEVAMDAARPFIVSTGNGEVVAVGTIFDVSLVSGGTCISLLKGMVDISQSRGGQGGRFAATLKPGEMVVLGAATPSLTRAQPADTAWASGMLAFENAPLRVVLASANRYSRQKVVFEDPALGTLRVTGTFRADRPSELAATLAQAFGLEVLQRGGNLVLRTRARPAS